MPGSTISTSVEVSVTLGSGGYTSPLSITSTGNIRPLMSGETALVSNGAADIIQNAGGIYGGLDGGNGVDLAGGGTLANGGTIWAGYGYDSVGVGVSLSAGTLTNTGLIQGGYGADDGQNGGDGVIILGNSTVTNHGSIGGGYGSSIGGTGAYQGGGLFTNTGHITGGGGKGGGGVGAIVTGGTFVNQGAVIGGENEPGMPAIGVELTGGSLSNYGLVAGGTAVVDLAGALTNASTGTIVGFGLFDLPAIGISLPNGGTVVNAGTISGSNGGDAILFGAKPSRLILQPGAVFSGAVVADGSAGNILELAAGAGTLSGGIGNQYQGFATISVDSGANWMITGSNSIAYGYTLVTNGHLDNAGTIIGAVAMVAAYTASVAVSITSGGSLNNKGLILGGNNESPGIPPVIPGAQGQGGTGIVLTGGMATNTGTISGGGGGSGSGIGGLGARLVASTMFNSGTIRGGNAYGRNASGAGIYMSGSALTNDGVIAGGLLGPEYSGEFAEGSGNGVIDFKGVVTNNGTITGGDDEEDRRGSAAGTGVFIYNGTCFNNGLINGGYGGGTGVSLGGGTLVNAGTIGGGAGSGGVGAYVTGGTFLNQGSVIGGENESGMPATGIVLSSGSFSNYGLVAGGTAVVDLGGSLTNANTGTIEGFGLFNLTGIGIFLSNGGTVINAGTISGNNGGDAILFGAKPSRLILQPGAVFSGAVVANVEPRYGPGYTYKNVMELAAGTAAGTLSGGIGYEYQGFDTISVDSGADWTITGVNTIAVAESLFSNGTLYNAGTIIGAAGTYTFGVNSPSTAIYVDCSGSLNNTGVILGGDNQGTSAVDMAFGVGGTGIVLAGSAINIGTTAGGQGGVGRRGGGNGAYVRGTMYNTGIILGGAGTYKGGKGVVVGLSGTLINNGFITGGDTSLNGSAGSGVANYYGTVFNNGTIVSGDEVSGANGGTGVVLSGAQPDIGFGVFINDGIIYGSFGSSFGGVGVEFNSGTLINAGTISGSGADGVAGVDQYAIKFTGSDNPIGFYPSGHLIVEPGAVFVGTVISNPEAGNTMEMAAGTANKTGTLDMGGTFVGIGSILFDSSAPWLLEGNTISLADGQTITNFNGGDTMVLEGFTAASDSFVTGRGLILSDGINTETLGITGSFTTDSFTITDIAQGTEIQLLCYLHGTKILTPAGEVPVEALRIGDELVTFFGGVRKIKWIGRQSFNARFVQNNRDRLPVRIAAGALGRGLPKCDLSISPGHSMFLGGRLVLAKSLINGITITQGPAMEDIHYFLIEFETHDCVQAEGVWSESFADGPGLRNQFHNAAAFFALYPDYQTPAALQLCAPRPEHGPALAAALRPVVRRAAARATAGPLRGYIDIVTAGRIEGWAQDENNPELPVLLEVLAGSRVIGTVLACDYRADLAAAGIGQGRCHFVFRVPTRYATATIRVRRAADGAEIAMSDDCRDNPVGKLAAGG